MSPHSTSRMGLCIDQQRAHGRRQQGQCDHPSNDPRITLDVSKTDKLFACLHVSKEGGFGFADWRQALADKRPKFMDSRHKVLGGRHLQEPPRSNGMDLQDAAKIPSNLNNYQNRRRMCMKLTQLADRKTYVIREACQCLGNIMIEPCAQCVKLAVCMLEALYAVILLTDNGAKVLIRFIADSKKLAKACADKGCSSRLRVCCIEQDRSQRFWAYVTKILHSGTDKLLWDGLHCAQRHSEIEVNVYLWLVVVLFVSLLTYYCLILAHSIKRIILAQRISREAPLQ